MNFLDKVFSGKPSRADFAQMIIQALHKAGIEKVDESVSDFSLKLERGGTLFLSNVYANFCSAPRSARQSIVSEFVTAAASIPELPSIPSDFAAAKPSLMPVIRDAAYFSMVQLMNRKNGNSKDDRGLDVVLKNLAGGLVVGLAYDTERNIASINRDFFEPWGVSLDEAFKAAKENLWEKTDPNRLAGQGGVYRGEWADSYDSSRILLTELIYRLSVDGDPVAFVPNRDQLWVTGTQQFGGTCRDSKGWIGKSFQAGPSPLARPLRAGRWNLESAYSRR